MIFCEVQQSEYQIISTTLSLMILSLVSMLGMFFVKPWLLKSGNKKEKKMFIFEEVRV